MARSKRRAKKPKSEKEEDGGRVYEEPDLDSEDFYHDAVDKFYANREKIMLESTGVDNNEGSDKDSYEDEEEVMGLDINESDEDTCNASEDEEEESDSEDDASDKGLPNAKAWGKKKSSYYATDDVGADVGSDEDLLQLAEEEEEEALALQKQMAAALEDQDFDTTDFEVAMKDDNEKEATDDDEQDKEKKEKIIKDLTKLSKEEKLEILIKDSPELLELLDEFKQKLTDLIDKLHPLVEMARAGAMPSDGANYVELKHQLYVNYCINIGFYLLLKARQTPVREHPVIGRLVQYRGLIKELEPVDKKLAPELQALLEQRSSTSSNGVQGPGTAKKVKETALLTRKTKKKETTRKLSELLDDNHESDNFTVRRKTKEKRRRCEDESLAEQVDPLEYYESVKMSKKRKKEAKERLTGANDELEIVDEDVVEGKRQISYEIFKNKGLTAKKKKELRNPRVKHRKKFRKAAIQRKSQVRPVVNEQSRYGGEVTGIRRNLSRSTKIK